MEIDLVWGTGKSRTHLGSFDRALSNANIHNYNLVTLSSVIPEDAVVIERGQLEKGRWDVGDMVSVVLAENTGTEPGSTIAAGLGWMTAEEGGVFMENSSGTRKECEHELMRNMEDAKETRDWGWDDDVKTKVVERTVEDVESVIVCAVYRPLRLRGT